MTARSLPTVQRALARVMADVRAVGKGDYNDEDGFAFRGIDAIVNAVAPALRKHGVIVAPTVKDVTVESVNLGEHRAAFPHIRVTVRYRWFGPAGDHIDCTVVGEAIDTGDKGIAKAMSVAWRIALLQTLALPTNEPDPDASTYRRSTTGTDADVARAELETWVVAEGIDPQEAIDRWADAHPEQHISASTDADEIRAMRDLWAEERNTA